MCVSLCACEWEREYMLLFALEIKYKQKKPTTFLLSIYLAIRKSTADYFFCDFSDSAMSHIWPVHFLFITFVQYGFARVIKHAPQPHTYFC